MAGVEAGTKNYVAAVDQGTTSSRCIIFNNEGKIVGQAGKEHTQHYPNQGWLEHDPVEIWGNVQAVITGALADAGVTASQVAGVGITNQRETSVVWNKKTGKPYHNAIVWSDTRTQPLCDALCAGHELGQNRFAKKTGLPVVPYFSATKIMWLLENVDGLRAAAESGEAIFGTMDTWVAWNLTGGTDGGIHITDVTNASRTLLMDLQTLQWDDGQVKTFNIPKAMLPAIKSSSDVYGTCKGLLAGVPVAGILGDQQAALVGQACFNKGEAKNTYGTGCFVMLNTGTDLVYSNSGLLSTVAYKMGDEPVRYALEGSVAVAGSLIQWLRDNLKMIDNAPQVETYAKEVKDNGGVYFVPAFSGLFAPYWRSDARGAIVGLTAYATRSHICRAALESTAFQAVEVLDAMAADGVPTTQLKVDGGMTANNTLMQFQADVLDAKVVKSTILETTALGAAYAAGLATGVWKTTEELAKQWQAAGTFSPAMEAPRRAALRADWKKAISKSMGWVSKATDGSDATAAAATTGGAGGGAGAGAGADA